jgi:hypothetical protein
MNRRKTSWPQRPPFQPMVSVGYALKLAGYVGIKEIRTETRERNIYADTSLNSQSNRTASAALKR